MKLKKEQQMGVPQKSKVMRYSYRIAFFLLTCFLPVFLQEAKAQRYIKLAKNIFYVGEVVEKRPYGRGMIIVKKDMNTIVFTITGTFQGNEITGNNISIPGISIEDWAAEVETLTFSKIIYSIDKKTDLSLELINTTYSIKLSYSFDKQRKKWKQDVLYCPNNVVDTYYREAYKEEIECTMRTIDLSFDLLDGTGLIKDCGNRKLLYDNGIVVEMDKSQQHFRTTSSMGTVEGILSSDGHKIDNFSIKAKDGSSWTATMTENRLNSTIHFADSCKYEGIAVKGDSFEYGVFGDKLLQLNKIDVKFIDGKFTKPDGQVITWINGETEEARHRRLSNKDLLNRTFPRKTFGTSVSDIKVPHRAYDSTLKESKIKTLQALVNNDAAEYFHIENIKTELQKKAFSQSEEYQTIYLPRMQQERKNLFEDEYRATFSIKGSEIKDFKYNMKNGTFEFEMRDTKNAEINKGVSDFHILFDEYLCLSYPRSLVALTKGTNFFDENLYIQHTQTCKVSESDALKVENNIENCEIVWIFKFEKVKDRYIYGKTTRIYIADKKTGKIYCDLTPSLKASQTKFKSVTTIKDTTPKKVYHERGRMEDCGLCFGTGKGWQGGFCIKCGGKGWYIEHYW